MGFAIVSFIAFVYGIPLFCLSISFLVGGIKLLCGFPPKEKISWRQREKELHKGEKLLLRCSCGYLGSKDSCLRWDGLEDGQWYQCNVCGRGIPERWVPDFYKCHN